MDGDGSTSSASEENQPDAGASGAGGSGDGAAPVTPSADAFAEERNKLTTQIRDFQSQRDQLKAELDKLKAGTSPEPGSATSKPETLTAEGVMALLRREREMTSAVGQLKSDFSFADEAIFTGYDKFESVEAFRAAAEASHNRIKGLVDSATKPAIEAAVEAAIKPYVEKYGRLSAPPAPAGEGTPNGMPTLEEVKGYSQAQLDAFVAQHGEKALNDLIYGNTITL